MQDDFQTAADPILKPGALLVRWDHLDMYRFKSVVLLLKHGVNRSAGIMINSVNSSRSYDSFCAQYNADILRGQGEENRVFLAGAHPDFLNPYFPPYVAFLDGSDPSTLKYFDSDAPDSWNQLQALAAIDPPPPARAAVGCLTWEAGELEKEIRAGFWGVISYNHDLIFNTKLDKIWGKASFLDLAQRGRQAESVLSGKVPYLEL